MHPGKVSRRRISTAIGVLLISSSIGPRVIAQSLPQADDCTLFAGVSLLTMEEEGFLDGQDVLVCGATVRSLGASGTLDSPASARRIEGSGRVLMPGLVDGHVHLFAPPDLELNLVWGVTTARNLFGNPMVRTLRDRVAAGEMWGPRLVTAGPIVDGEPPIWPGSAAVTSAEEARRTVAEQLEAGYDFIKVYSRLEREPFLAAIDAAKAADVRVGGHVPPTVPLAEAARHGIDFIEHLTGFLPALQSPDSEWQKLSEEERKALDRYEAIRLQVEGFDPGRLPVVAGWMRENGVWNVPTFVVIERITASAEQKEEWASTHPQMRTINAMTRNMWNPRNDFRLQNVTAEQLAARHRSAELHAPIVKALHDAGAELMLGTDTPNPFVFPGFSVHEELERFVGAGLTPYEALRTATVNAARYLGLEGVIGRITVGAEADLVLLDANPLESIESTRRIRGVMTRGRWLDRAELDRRLDAVARTYGNE